MYHSALSYVLFENQAPHVLHVKSKFLYPFTKVVVDSLLGPKLPKHGSLVAFVVRFLLSYNIFSVF